MLLTGLESIANPFPPSQYAAGVRDAHVSERANLLTDPAVCVDDRGQCLKSRASEFDRPGSCAFPLGRKGAMHAGTH